MRPRALPLAAAGMAALLAIAPPATAAPGDQIFVKSYPELTNGGRSAVFTAGVAQPDGKLVLAGYRYETGQFGDANVLLARVDAKDGALDPTFGTGGFTILPIDLKPNGDDFANALAISPNGSRLYVVGEASATGGRQAFVAALTGTGTPDPGFGGAGVRSFNFGPGAGRLDGATSLLVDGMGTVTVGGVAFGGAQSGLGMARFDASGQPVAGFGGGAPFVTPLAGSGADRVQQLFDLGSGQVAALGIAEPGTQQSDLAFVEYDAAGAVVRAKVLATPGIDFGAKGIYNSENGLVLIRTANIDFANVAETLRFTPALEPVPGSGGRPFAIPSFGRAIAPLGTGFLTFGAKPGEGVGSDEWALAPVDANGVPTGPARTYPGTPQLFERAMDLVMIGGNALLVGGQGTDGGTDVPALAAVDEGGGDDVVKPPPAIDHYRVELKAWIPHQVVVDPAHPFRLPFVVGFLGNDCYDPGVFSRDFRKTVVSLFNGNAHVPYDGSFKGHVVAEFDWDGSQISNFVESKAFGPTMRFLEYQVEDIVSQKTRLVRCTIQSGQATRAASAEKIGPNTVKQRIETNIPLIAVAPPIDDQLVSVVSGAPPESRLDISYDSDLFPSHGLRVIKNGVTQATETFSDASCLPGADVLGLGGSLRIGWGLTHYDKHGSYAVGPRDVGRVGAQPSLLCAPTYLILQAVDLAKAINAQFSTAPSLSVAAIDAAGKRGPWLTAAVASDRGLVQIQRDGDRVSVFSRAATPVAVRVRGKLPAVQVTEPAAAGKRARTRLYRGKRELIASQGATVAVTSGGRKLRAGAVDRRPPVTRATVIGRGARVQVRFRARDASGVAAVNVLLKGKRLKLDRRGSVRVKRADLPRVRFGSVDVFGNEEPLRALPRRR